MSESFELVSHEKGVAFMLSRTWLGRTRSCSANSNPCVYQSIGATSLYLHL